jgi:EpsI family protein
MTLQFRNLILFGLMLAASGLALALRPTEKIADTGPPIDLQTMVPHTFGDWHDEPLGAIQMVDPQQKEMIDMLYSQTLMRTYVNAEGYRIMLSMAYGDNQNDSMQLHYPEVCYPAQGFTLMEKQPATLETGDGPVAATRILTSLGLRQEPVTYWTVIGNQVFRGGLEKKLAEMRYGLLKRQIPDGMLIRVSSIDSETASAYNLHQQFASQMLAGMAPEFRQKLTGTLQPGSPAHD